MKTVGSYEAKTHLPRLLEEVRRGAEITITRHGVPVARLVPFAGHKVRDAAEVIAELKEARKGTFLNGDSIAEMKALGRR